MAAKHPVTFKVLAGLVGALCAQSGINVTKLAMALRVIAKDAEGPTATDRATLNVLADLAGEIGKKNRPAFGHPHRVPRDGRSGGRLVDR